MPGGLTEGRNVGQHDDLAVGLERQRQDTPEMLGGLSRQLLHLGEALGFAKS